MMIQQHPGFFVVGLAARTKNANEMNGKGKIEEIWQTLLGQNLVAKIPNKLGTELFAVYTDYENDHTGDYTYLLGVPVSSSEGLPTGLTLTHVPARRYAVVSSRRGPIVEVVQEVWQRIWSMSSEELGGTRAYQADYEVYDGRAADPENGQIDVYIGLR